jgi:flagellar hook-length control protein FliK
VTAGLIAASMALSSAAARAMTTSQTVTDPASSDDAMLEDAEIRGSTGKPASAAVGTPSDADADAAGPRALPELSAELSRTTARDRLTQDFEQRFENSLARAVGAPSGGTASGASPLLLAGLPPQPMPAQAATPVAHASIASPLSHPAFGDDLAHRVLLFAGQRVQSAEISLTPGDLGPIRVSLELRGQEASVQFNAAHAATRSAIEDALPRLREMLAAQGLQLAQADVGDRAPRDPQGGRGGDGGRPQPGLADTRAAALGANGDATAAGAISGRRVGLIDVRV